MRAILKLTVAAAALMAVTGTAMAAMKAPGATSAPLAVPLGVTYAAARAALPPGVTAEQAAMAAAMGMMRNAEIYADGNGMTLYTFDPNVKLSTDTTIGTLVDDTGAKALLEKNFPGLSTNPALGQARGMTLKAVKQFLPGLTDEKLKSLDEELGKLPPSGPVVTSCTGETESNVSRRMREPVTTTSSSVSVSAPAWPHAGSPRRVAAQPRLTASARRDSLGMVSFDIEVLLRIQMV